MIINTGVLGEVQASALGTYTIYQAPANRGAKGKLLLRFQGNAGSILHLRYNDYYFLNTSGGYLVDANYFYTQSGDGILRSDQLTIPDGTAANRTAAPSGVSYIFGPGDTLSMKLAGAAFVSGIAQFIGYEFEAITPQGSRVGVLGRNNGITNGLHTLYTVPKGKTAIGSFHMQRFLTSGAGTIDVSINGITILSHSSLNLGAYSTSGPQTPIGIGAATSEQSGNTVGMQSQLYRLNEDDVITYTLTLAGFVVTPLNDVGASINPFIQFVGSEYPIP